MNTDSPTVTNTIQVERLQQAVRVMEGLSDAERANFNIDVVAVQTEDGICACVAGHCGMDPWFQAQGFVTKLDTSVGSVSKDPAEFFGTDKPFYAAYYVREIGHRKPTVEDAIAALKQAIPSAECTPESTKLVMSS